MRARRALSLIATSLLLVCGCAATNPPAPATLTAAEPRYEAEQKRLRKAIEQGGDLGPRGVEDRSPAQLAGTVEALSQLALAKRHNHMVDDELVDTLVLGVTAFAKAYDRYPDVRAQKSGSPFSRAEASLSAWLQESLPEIVRGPRGARLVKAVFHASSQSRTPFERRWPGVDTLAIGAQIAAQWIKNAHVDTEISSVVLCPPAPGTESVERVDADGGPFSRHEKPVEAACVWPQLAVASLASAEQFAAVLRELNDERLTEAVFANLGAAPADDVVHLWRATHSTSKVWRAAARAIAEHLGTKEGFDDEAKRLWTRPEDRGVALYLMAQRSAQLARGAMRADDWERFASNFGGPIDDDTVEAMLSVSPRAVEVVPRTWLAFRRGHVPTLAAIRHLDAYLDDARTRNIPGAATTLLKAIGRQVCLDHKASEDTAWAQYLHERATNHTADFLDYASYARNKRCS